MKNIAIGSPWINAVLRGFCALGLDLKVITKDLPGFNGIEFNFEQRLDIGATRELWHRAQTLSQDPLMGAKMGLAGSYRAIGVLAPIIWHSENALDAIKSIIRYQPLHGDGGLFRCHQIQDTVQCSYEPRDHVVPPSPHQIQALIVGTVSLLNNASHHSLIPYLVGFKDKVDEKEIGSMLQTTVISEHSDTCIYYKLDDLKRPFIGRDLYLYKLTKAYAEELLSTKIQGIELISEVKQFIRLNGFSKVNIEQLSNKLAIPIRGLQSSISEQGTSFRLLKEETCKETAMEHFKNGKSIDALIGLLGYSEASAFYRAFKNWFGTTPKEYLRHRILK